MRPIIIKIIFGIIENDLQTGNDNRNTDSEDLSKKTFLRNHLLHHNLTLGSSKFKWIWPDKWVVGSLSLWRPLGSVDRGGLGYTWVQKRRKLLILLMSGHLRTSEAWSAG